MGTKGYVRTRNRAVLFLQMGFLPSPRSSRRRLVSMIDWCSVKELTLPDLALQGDSSHTSAIPVYFGGPRTRPGHRDFTCTKSFYITVQFLANCYAKILTVSIARRFEHMRHYTFDNSRTDHYVKSQLSLLRIPLPLRNPTLALLPLPILFLH